MRTAKDRDRWKGLADGYILQWMNVKNCPTGGAEREMETSIKNNMFEHNSIALEDKETGNIPAVEYDPVPDWHLAFWYRPIKRHTTDMIASL